MGRGGRDVVSVEEAVKCCGKCGEVKNLADFSPNPSNRDGRHTWCKPCANEANKARTAARLAADPARERARQREAVRRSRQKPEVRERERLAKAARLAATADLVEAHRDEFEQRLKLRRYESGLG